jgi:hypothetical protein
MKVAVCISGQLRTYEECYANLIKNILAPLNADVFMQVWDTVGASHKEKIANLDQVDEKKLIAMYNPKKLVIEKQPEGASDELYGKKVPQTLKETEPLHYKSALSMYYQIKMCNDLAVNYAAENGFKYDIIMRVRPDTMFLEQVPQKYLQKVIDNSTLLYFVDYAINTKYAVCDKFAFGGTEGMSSYASVWDKIEEHWEKPFGNNPPFTHKVGERLLKFHVDNEEELIARPFYLDVYNLRTDGGKVSYKWYNRFKKYNFLKYK